ncbi:MAG: DNA/RNA nuclease SfsA, partial [Calditrichales bacterium]
VKNVTLVEDDGGYYFPDSVTERGRKHLYELIDMVKQGHRSVMFYVIQRGDGNLFRPATHIDPAYAAALKEAVENGVEIIAYRAEVSPEKIEIVAPVPWELD